MAGHCLLLDGPADVSVLFELIIYGLGHRKHHRAHVRDVKLCYGLRGQEKKHAQSRLGELLVVTGSKYLVYQLLWQSLAVVGMRGAVFFVSYYHQVALSAGLNILARYLKGQSIRQNTSAPFSNRLLGLSFLRI